MINAILGFATGVAVTLFAVWARKRLTTRATIETTAVVASNPSTKATSLLSKQPPPVSDASVTATPAPELPYFQISCIVGGIEHLRWYSLVEPVPIWDGLGVRFTDVNGNLQEVAPFEVTKVATVEPFTFSRRVGHNGTGGQWIRASSVLPLGTEFSEAAREHYDPNHFGIAFEPPDAVRCFVTPETNVCFRSSGCPMVVCRVPEAKPLTGAFA